MALLIVIVFNLPGLITYFNNKDTNVTTVGVVDQTNEVYQPLAQQIIAFGFDQLKLLPVKNEEEATSKLNSSKINSYLIIDSIDKGSISATYKAQQITDSNVPRKLEQVINQVQFRMKASTLGLTVDQAAQLFKPMTIIKIPLAKDAKSEEEIVQSQVLVYILLFAIYFGVLMYGNLVATEVAKEKSSRVMEILVSSVNPIKQMFGKILGIALLGIFQTAIFIIIGYISMKFGNKTVDFGNMKVDFSNIPVETIIFAVIFYILGYLLFATIAATLGSLVSRVEDLQQSLTPLNLVIVIAFMIAMFGLTKPDAMFVVVSSYIPIFTPIIMFLRIGVGNPALWEIFITIGLLILTIIGVALLAAKVYRGGVLMYGKGTSFKNMKQAIHLHKNN